MNDKESIKSNTDSKSRCPADSQDRNRRQGYKWGCYIPKEKGEFTILNVYQVSGKNKKDISLLFRVFCQKNDYITFEVDCNKWRTGALLYLICRNSGWCEYWWNYHQLEFLTDRDAKRVESTLRRWNHNNMEYEKRAAFILFDQYQQR